VLFEWAGVGIEESHKVFKALTVTNKIFCSCFQFKNKPLDYDIGEKFWEEIKTIILQRD
jgi:hypothetical protein